MFSSFNEWWSKLTGQSASSATAAPNFVVTVSHLLNMSEFEVFHAAYHHWFGVDSDMITIESSFTTYIFEGEIPFWTRHFCQHILTQAREDRLDPSEYRKQRRRPAAIDYRIVNTLVA